MRKLLLMTTLFLGACGQTNGEAIDAMVKDTLIQDATGNYHRRDFIMHCSVSDTKISSTECVARGGLVGQMPEHQRKALIDRTIAVGGCGLGCQQLMLNSAIRDLNHKIDRSRGIVFIR